MADPALANPFLQSLRPADVAHQRRLLLNWWSIPGPWQHHFALQGRRKIDGWSGSDFREAEDSRWWMEQTLRKAELYWVSPEMTEVISTLSASIPDTVPQPPVPDALVIFAKSVPGTDATTGQTIHTSAILWGEVTMYHTGTCIAAETYAWRDLVNTYQELSEHEQGKFRDIYPNRLMPTGGSEWPLGSLTSDFSLLPAEDELMHQSILEDRRLLSTFWALCSQRIVVESVERPGRAAARQAQREGRKLDEVRVVRLREPTAHAAAVPGGAVDWSHRWVVGSHWRNQWYPSKGTHAPKLIEAYVKGPDDKPLKVRETVRALVR